MSTAPKEVAGPGGKLSKGKKRRMKKQQRKHQALLEQEFEELEEIECREHEQRLIDTNILPEGDQADSATAVLDKNGIKEDTEHTKGLSGDVSEEDNDVILNEKDPEKEHSATVLPSCTCQMHSMLPTACYYVLFFAVHLCLPFCLSS